MQSLTHFYFIPLACAALLAGCAGTNAPGVKPEVIENKTPLNSIRLKDEGLQYCVSKAAQVNHWQTIGDVTSLNCRRLDKGRLGGPADPQTIKDSSEINQFTALKHLDVAGNFYTKIDVSALTQLERLDVYEALSAN